MSEAWSRREVIGDAVLYLGDCRDVLAHVGQIDALVTDPHYFDLSCERIAAARRQLPLFVRASTEQGTLEWQE